MNILVIGSGAREHAICRQFSKSAKAQKCFCAPSNDGITCAQKTNIAQNDFESLARFAKENSIDFTFVGPETPLSEGIVDFFESKGLKIIGPSKAAARLESSKIYSKNFMKKYGIPTADYQSFNNIKDAINFLRAYSDGKKLVVKADGLAAGKGVYICEGKEEAQKIVYKIMEEKIFGNAGASLVIEEFLEGEELSYLVFLDGAHYSIMPASQDHKRVFDNDCGLNTGGMGAYSPAPLATDVLNKTVEEEILKKVLIGIEKEKLDYKGILYIGVIVCGGKPYTLEFNCRFGDPETQAVLALLETDLVDICGAILDKKLDEIEIKWKDDFAVCVVLSSGGYPQEFEKGFEIKGIDSVKDAEVFCAGVKERGGVLTTDGGRVLSVVSQAPSVKEAVEKVYSQVEHISFEKMHYRKDIAAKALKHS